MKKYIIVGMFSFLLGAIVALGISNITQSPATPMAKESFGHQKLTLVTLGIQICGMADLRT